MGLAMMLCLNIQYGSQAKMGEPCPIQPGRQCPRIFTAQPLFEVRNIPLILNSESFAWIGTRLRCFGHSASDLKILLGFYCKTLSCKLPASRTPVLSSVIRLPWYSRCVSILYPHVSSASQLKVCLDRMLPRPASYISTRCRRAQCSRSTSKQDFKSSIRQPIA